MNKPFESCKYPELISFTKKSLPVFQEGFFDFYYQKWTISCRQFFSCLL
jgi:hypothetical protein